LRPSQKTLRPSCCPKLVTDLLFTDKPQPNCAHVCKYCCDRKSRAAYAQSFALWQQATIEFTYHDHSSRTLLLRSIVDIVSITLDYTPRSLYYCLFAPHICMVLFIGVWERILLGGRKKFALKITICPKNRQLVLKLTF